MNNMIMTLGEFLRKNDRTLAIAVVISMRLRESKDIENFEDYKDDVLFVMSRLKTQIDTDNPFPWAH